jgi:hypothetical protein
MLNFQTVIELRDPTLGRLLARNWNRRAITEVRKILNAGLSADDYAAHLFAAISRVVPEEAPATEETFDTGNAIDYATVGELAQDKLDDLARAYLEEAAKWMGGLSGPESPSASDPIDVPANERQTERLRRLATSYIEHSDTRSRGWTSLQSVLVSGVSPTLADAFTHTAAVAGSIQDALLRLRESGGVGSLAKELTRPPFGDSATFGSLAKELTHPPFGDSATFGSFAKELTRPLSWDSDATLGSFAKELSRDRLRDRTLNASSLRDALPPFSNFDVMQLKPLPNPIHETNAELAAVSTKIEQLVEIGRQQAELAQALTRTSQLALEESVNSGKSAEEALRQSRNGVWLALATLVLSVIVAGLNIWVSRTSSASADAGLERLITSVETLRSATSVTGASDSSRRELEIRTLQEIERELRDMRKPIQPSPSGGKKLVGR